MKEAPAEAGAGDGVRVSDFEALGELREGRPGVPVEGQNGAGRPLLAVPDAYGAGVGPGDVDAVLRVGVGGLDESGSGERSEVFPQHVSTTSEM